MKTMMVVEGEKDKDNQTLVFFLTEGLEGGVALRVRGATDSEDDGWWIVEVTPGGKLKRYSSLPSQDFFQVEDPNNEYELSGYIQLEDE